MRRLRGFALVVLALAGPACDSPLGPAGVTGHWKGAIEVMGEWGFIQHHLTLLPDGTYRSEERLYRGGLPERELTAYSREEGRFHVSGDTLFVDAHRLVEWDNYCGTGSPAHVYEPYPYGRSPFDGARFIISRERLVVQHATGAAGAPGETREFYRARVRDLD